MITKDMLHKLLGKSNADVAKRLGYTGYRADNNISRLPAILTNRQARVIIMRMRAENIKVPKSWMNDL